MNERPLVMYVGGEDVRMRIPLLQKIRQHGFAVVVLGSEPADSFDRHGIRYHRYPLARGVAPFSDLRTKMALKNIFQKERPDLIHAFDTKPAIFAPVCARHSGIKSVVRTITGMGYVFSSEGLIAKSIRPLYRSFQKKASRASGMTIFQNTEDYQYFIDNGMVVEKRATVVKGSGIDVDDFLKKMPSAKEVEDLREELGLGEQRVVSLVTRIVREKGVIEFLQAAQEVCSCLTDVTFLLIGPRNEGRWQEVPCKEIDAFTNEHVRYLGPQNNIPGLLSLSSIFVLPTYYREGVPRVLLEAGAAGLPLITTDMPGCRDVVQDQWNGLLVPPRDPIQLASAIKNLLNSPGPMLSEMGEKSRSHVRNNFELSLIENEYVGIYKRLLSQDTAYMHGC